MKVLLVIPALGPVYGGPSKIAPATAAALARAGTQADVAATNANGPGNLPVPLGQWVEQDGHRTRYFARWGRAEYKPSLSLLWWLLRRVRDYDAVHIDSDFNFPVLAAALACRLRGVPYVLNPQGMLEPWALDYKAGKKRLYYHLVERPLVIRGAGVIQALNRREAANLAALRTGRPIETVPNGVDPQEAGAADPAAAAAFRARFPEACGKTVLLFLHRVDPKKGLDVLARAYAEVRPRFPDTHLIVAGPPAAGYEDQARGFFRDAGVAAAVTFTGLLGGGLKRGAFAAADVFLAPTYSEGFSMAVLEAMCAGLPSVLTEGCNFPEAGVAGGARVVPTGDAGAFADALADLLADPAEARAMGARARALVLAHYTWDQVAARLGRIFAGIARP